MAEQWDDVKVGDLVLGKRHPYFQAQGKIRDIKDVHRGKEVQVDWKNGALGWTKTAHLWLINGDGGQLGDDSSNRMRWDTVSTLSDLDGLGPKWMDWGP